MPDNTTAHAAELKEGWYWATRIDTSKRHMIWIEGEDGIRPLRVYEYKKQHWINVDRFRDFVPIPSEAEVQETRETIEKLKKTLRQLHARLCTEEDCQLDGGVEHEECFSQQSKESEASNGK